MDDENSNKGNETLKITTLDKIIDKFKKIFFSSGYKNTHRMKRQRDTRWEDGGMGEFGVGPATDIFMEPRNRQRVDETPFTMQQYTQNPLTECQQELHQYQMNNQMLQRQVKHSLRHSVGVPREQLAALQRQIKTLDDENERLKSFHKYVHGWLGTVKNIIRAEITQNTQNTTVNIRQSINELINATLSID